MTIILDDIEYRESDVKGVAPCVVFWDKYPGEIVPRVVRLDGNTPCYQQVEDLKLHYLVKRTDIHGQITLLAMMLQIVKASTLCGG